MNKKKQKELQPDREENGQEEGALQGAPLLVHLQALRHVLIVSAAAVIIAFFLVFYLAIEQLMAWIIGPIAERASRSSIPPCPKRW